MPVVRLLSTEGGPHAAADMAEWTALHVMDVLGTVPGLLYADAMAVQGKVGPLLVDLHQLVQSDERARLRDQGPDRLLAPIDVSAETTEAVKRIEVSITGMMDPAQLASCLRSHLHHTAWIERSWYADACMGEPAAVAFFSTGEGGPAAEHANHVAAQAFRAHGAEGHSLLLRDEAALDALGGRAAVNNLIAVANPHGSEG